MRFVYQIENHFIHFYHRYYIINVSSNVVAKEYYFIIILSITTRSILFVAVGDCTRALMMIGSIKNGQGLPPIVDIDVEGEKDNPRTWSTVQMHAWAQSESLKNVADKMKEQRMAGDIIATMNIDIVALLLGLSMDEEGPFHEGMKKLQSSLAASKSGQEKWIIATVIMTDPSFIYYY